MQVDSYGLKNEEVPLSSTIDLKPGTDHVLDRHFGNYPDWEHKTKWTGNKSNL